MMDKSREQFETWFNDMMEPNFKKYQIDTPEQKLVRDISWLAWKKSRTALCPKCGGTGMADSGGVQPWGEPIEIPCDCPFGDNK